MLLRAFVLHQGSKTGARKREAMAQASPQGHGARQRSGLVRPPEQPHCTPLWGELRRHL